MSAQEKYTMPQGYLGQIVHWYRHGQPGHVFPAMVIKGSPWERSNLDLLVTDPMGRVFVIRGAKHQSDPSWNPETDLDRGTWEYNPWDLLTVKMEERLEQMERTLAKQAAKMKGKAVSVGDGEG